MSAAYAGYKIKIQQRVGPGRPLPELARTGPASLSWTGAAAGALLLGGTALVRYARRIRRTAD
ncbi:LPXTG cell wall anchor domain-containing protein [Streptomyces anulatus]